MSSHVVFLAIWWLQFESTCSPKSCVLKAWLPSVIRSWKREEVGLSGRKLRHWGVPLRLDQITAPSSFSPFASWLPWGEQFPQSRLLCHGVPPHHRPKQPWAETGSHNKPCLFKLFKIFCHNWNLHPVCCWRKLRVGTTRAHIDLMVWLYVPLREGTGLKCFHMSLFTCNRCDIHGFRMHLSSLYHRVLGSALILRNAMVPNTVPNVKWIFSRIPTHSLWETGLFFKGVTSSFH